MVGRGLRCRAEGRQRFSIFYLFFNLPRSGGWNGLVVDYGAIGGVRVVKFVLRSLVFVILIEVLEEANQVPGLAHLVGQDFGVGFDFAGFGGGAGPGAGGDGGAAEVDAPGAQFVGGAVGDAVAVQVAAPFCLTGGAVFADALAKESMNLLS